MDVLIAARDAAQKVYDGDVPQIQQSQNRIAQLDIALAPTITTIKAGRAPDIENATHNAENAQATVDKDEMDIKQMEIFEISSHSVVLAAKAAAWILIRPLRVAADAALAVSVTASAALAVATAAAIEPAAAAAAANSAVMGASSAVNANTDAIAAAQAGLAATEALTAALVVALGAAKTAAIVPNQRATAAVARVVAATINVTTTGGLATTSAEAVETATEIQEKIITAAEVETNLLLSSLWARKLVKAEHDGILNTANAKLSELNNLQDIAMENAETTEESALKEDVKTQIKTRDSDRVILDAAIAACGDQQQPVIIAPPHRRGDVVLPEAA